MEPGPVTLQVTCWFALPVMVAVSCTVWLTVSEAEGGFTETVTGGMSVIAAAADFVESATLVAVTVTVSCVGMDAGAVYRPEAETEPVPAGERLQVTCWFVDPVTTAVSCCVWLMVSEADGGFTETVSGGFKVIAAEADCVGSATLVAVTVTVC